MSDSDVFKESSHGDSDKAHSLFPYLAETVLEELISKNLKVQNFVLAHFNIKTPRSVEVFRQCAFEISEGNGKLFDGEHKIDLCLVIDGAHVIPIEIKAGRVRPSISGSGVSADGKRFVGSMLSILDKQLFGEHGHLIVKLPSRPLMKIHADWWGIIARTNAIDYWNKNGTFKNAPRLVDLRQLMEHAGKEPFNDIVRKLLEKKDFYDEWL